MTVITYKQLLDYQDKGISLEDIAKDNILEIAHKLISKRYDFDQVLHVKGVKLGKNQTLVLNNRNCVVDDLEAGLLIHQPEKNILDFSGTVKNSRLVIQGENEIAVVMTEGTETVSSNGTKKLSQLLTNGARSISLIDNPELEELSSRKVHKLKNLYSINNPSITFTEKQQSVIDAMARAVEAERQKDYDLYKDFYESAETKKPVQSKFNLDK